MQLIKWNSEGLSLRARLLISYALILVIALLVAGFFAITSFSDAIDKQAERAIEANVNVAGLTLADRLDALERDITETAADPAVRNQVAAGAPLGGELKARANLLGANLLAFVDTSGQVLASSRDAAAYQTAWTDLTEQVFTGQTASFISVVPRADLEALGLAAEMSVEVKETDGGTVVPGEEDGALALVAVAPVKTSAGVNGAIVGVDLLKNDFAFVDGIVARLGGTATVFQGGVRVATTVKDAEGNRAIGTVISDPVRQATLEDGEPFRGRALVVGQDFLTAYDPLRGPSGDTLGMLYVGLPLQEFDNATTTFAIQYTLIIAAAILAGMIGANVISRALSRPVAAIGDAAIRVAGGDLTVQVPVAGYRESRALGAAFEHMITGLRTIISKVDDAATSLGSVSTEISAAARTSAEQATRQASSVAETTATVEELSRTFNAVAEGASRVLEIAEDAFEAAEQGQSTVAAGTQTMEDLTVGAHEVQEAASAMTGVAADITEMTIIISGIAEQTKILAMNAAIEAARAGDAGKGFGVVATEIRTLADSVGRSAGRISQLVNGIQAASHALASTAENQAQLTVEGAAQAGRSNDAFASIVSQMSDTAAAAREIAAAATQQKVAADQIVSAMHQVSMSSNESASAARQLADAAGEVESEADGLKRGLSGFKTR